MKRGKQMNEAECWVKLKELEKEVEAGNIPPQTGELLYGILKHAKENGLKELEQAALKVASKLMATLPSETLELKPGEMKMLTESVFVSVEPTGGLAIWLTEDKIWHERRERKEVKAR